jgi:hypothetical protein
VSTDAVIDLRPALDAERRRRQQIYVAGVVAIAVAIGVAFRWWVLRSGQGGTISDESVTGLVSLDIVRRHDLHLVFPGQQYTLPLESYLMAPVLAITGASDVVLKLVAVLEWAVSAWLIGRIARLFVSRGAAHVVSAVAWIGAGTLLVISTQDLAGYNSGLALSLAAVYLAARAAIRHQPSRWESFAAGVCAGVAIWCHPMFAATTLPALAVTTWFHRRAWRDWWLMTAAGGVVGLGPFLAYNIRYGFPSLHFPDFGTPSTYSERLQIYAMQTLPRLLGFRSYEGVWLLGSVVGKLLYGLVLAGAAVGLVHAARRSRAGVVLLVATAVSPFIIGLLRPTNYYIDGRYAIVYYGPIVVGLAVAGMWLIGRLHAPVALAVFAPVLWTVLVAFPFADHLLEHDHTTPNADVDAVIGVLDRAAIDRVGADYFVAIRIEWRSDEHIRVATIDLPLVRFPRSQALVDAAPDFKVAYVFFPGQEQAALLRLPVELYTVVDVGGFKVYLPPG